MRKRTAAIQPVHAPVVGKGIATKSVNPIASYLSIIAALFLVLLNNQEKNFSPRGVLEKTSESLLRERRRGITGRRFPVTATM